MGMQSDIVYDECKGAIEIRRHLLSRIFLAYIWNCLLHNWTYHRSSSCRMHPWTTRYTWSSCPWCIPPAAAPVHHLSGHLADVRYCRLVSDPLLWNDREVRAWCEWSLSQYQVRPTRRKMLLDNLHHNGVSFSRLQEKDFTELFHSAGVYVYAELELWKNGEALSNAFSISN